MTADKEVERLDEFRMRLEVIEDAGEALLVQGQCVPEVGIFINTSISVMVYM